MRDLLSIGAVLVLLAACGEPNRPVDSGVPDDAGFDDAGFDAGTDDAGTDDAGMGDAGMDDAATPDGGSCSDGDGDGYGEGCALGADCADDDAARSPAASETCNGLDDDCDGATDEDVGAPSCALSEGVCAGATQRCGAGGFEACEASDYGADYEADETACDGMDNDCDGTTDEGCSCVDGATQACGSDVGACTMGVQTCADLAWGSCEGEGAPMGEVCDGLDNDCDGTEDEASDLTAPDCPLQLGVCSGSTRSCGGAAGWIACSGITSYGGDYEAVESLCDRLDNDCDGVTDEGCECVDGMTQPCGSDVGACMTGTQTCVAGAWGACAGEVLPAAETCDGTDEDCDGVPDDDVIAPPCALTDGVCAGATQTCGGAGGFLACDSTSYGPTYEETESACDGQDNDCDGVTDESCACVDGATQACGLATGTCTRGTQTCTAGVWGDCTGGVQPTAESCNGMDDDCDGTSDEDLAPPPCALTDGVCAGSTQTCAGAAGWTECAGTGSYGPRYLMTEDGSADEVICDGLDNDCNGTPDDNCVSGPVISGSEDTVAPDLYHRNLVFTQLIGGNWELMFQNLDRGVARQLTTTPENEDRPILSGDRVVFIRGADAGRRAVLYDLTTDTETVLSTGESTRVSISGRFVAWEENVGGTEWDVFVRDLVTGTTTNLGTPGVDDVQPTLRGARLAFASEASGNRRIHVVENTGSGWGAPVVQSAGAGAPSQNRPVMDFTGVTWGSDWDLFTAPFAAGGGLTPFPGGNTFASSAGQEVPEDMDSQIIVYADNQTGDWDVWVGLMGSAPVRVTSSSARQGWPSNSGSHIVWQDNRLGSFDIYQTFFGGATFRPGPGDIAVSEVLADPQGADVNGDGTGSFTEDEFVELVNITGVALDISGLQLSDGAAVRHVFADGTWLPAFGAVVVFGGGAPTGTFGGARVVTASTGTLGLTNGGDNLSLTDGGTSIATAGFGGIANNDESIVPDGTGGWLLHSTVPDSSGTWSPGVAADGYAW